ncbi:MAG: EamA family transporter, partial [Floccifex sp.]
MKTKLNLSKTGTVLLLALFSTFLWGCAPSFIKIGYELLHIDATQSENLILFAGLRFTLAGLLVILIQSIFQKKVMIPQKKNIFPIFVLAFFQTFGQYIFYYLGLSRTTGVNAAIITGTGALLSYLFSVY